jgi:hypothetical protein
MTDVFSKLQSAAHAGAFGMGSTAQPTPAQIRAGNYAKGSFRMHGLRITIETPMFQSRRGKQDGKPWSITCMAHYGYVNGTKGADGDAIDVFVGPAPESLRVYVINQNGKGGTFDEHKVMLGFTDQDQACAAYMNSYEKGWTGLGSVAACTIKQFKHWLKHGDLSRPLSPDLPNIPKDEALSMTDVFARWGADNLPEGQTVGALLYELRRTDPDGLLMDSATMADITEHLADDAAMLDAMVIEYKQFERKAAQLLKVMQNVGGEVQAATVEVSKPFKSKGTTQVAMLFAMDDGQSVSVFFHNPDSTPNKLTPSDELISWKWVQNKKDITAVVAPESGQDINPRIVARRIMALIQKNSAKFIKANEGKAARTAALDEQKALVEAKTGELASLDAQISDLTAQLEAKKAAPVAAEPALAPVVETAPVADPVTPVSTASVILEDYADIAALGEAVVLSTGSENVYLVKDGVQYMTKLLNTDVYDPKVGEVVDLSGVVDPFAVPALADPEKVQRLIGALTGARARLAGMAVGDAFYGNLSRDVVDMAKQLWDTGYRGPEVSEPAAAGAKPSYLDWEGDVLEALAELMDISTGDADSVALGQNTLVKQLYADGVAPAEAAKAIKAASTVAPETPEEEAMLAAHLAERAEEAAQAAAAAKLSADTGADEDTGTIEAEGRDNTVKTAKGSKVVTGFKVIEAKNLIISHETDGTVNPEYPPEIQPRDRARTTSQAWVQKTARNLDPDSLGRTQRADSGAPIVGADRVVESGNGRAMAIREAYRIGQADEYREWLVENAEYFGVDVAKIQRMKAPVLIRVRKTAINRVEFAVEANQDDKLAMTATEKARSDAKRLDTAMLAKLADGDLNSAANRDFVAAFLQSLGDAEAAQYLTTDGKPTSGLISRLQAALFAGAYSDDRLLEMTADQAKPEIANIVSALNSAAPDFMRAKEQDRVGAEKAGEQVTDSLELSLNQEAVNAIIGATNVLRQAKEAGMGLDEFLRQGDMFGGTDPAVAAMAVFISANNRSAKRMSTAFKAMAQFVESENIRKQTAGLFGDEPASFTDIVGAANRKLEQEYGEGLFAIDQTDMFSQPAASPAPEPEPVPEPDEDESLQQAKSYLDSIIGGTTDLGSPGDVLKELERIYAAYGEDKLSELFIEASDAFRDYALKATAGAF